LPKALLPLGGPLPGWQQYKLLIRRNEYNGANSDQIVAKKKEVYHDFIKAEKTLNSSAIPAGMLEFCWIPLDSSPIPVDSSSIPVESGGIQQNSSIPAGI